MQKDGTELSTEISSKPPCSINVMKRQLKNKDEFRAEDQMLGTNFKISEYMSNYRHTIRNLEIYVNK